MNEVPIKPNKYRIRLALTFTLLIGWLFGVVASAQTKVYGILRGSALDVIVVLMILGAIWWTYND